MGNIFVVTGPSGAGKDSVIERAKELELDFGSVITTTTRPMRPGEAEGAPYYFISHDDFEAKVARGEMIEWAEVYGNLYGSTKDEIERARKKYEIVIIKVDPQGARTYKEMIPDAITIFIQPPSVEYLKKRLVHRGSDSQEVIEKRLDVAGSELKNLQQWDRVILNDEGKLDDAAKELIHIVNEQ